MTTNSDNDNDNDDDSVTKISQTSDDKTTKKPAATAATTSPVATDIPGCMYISACNYNALATADDGKCVYAQTNKDCFGNCEAKVDCKGVCGGNVVLDVCGVCGGDHS